VSGDGLYLGIDGGGSSSAVLVRDAGREIRFTRLGGPLNVTALAESVWQSELDRLLDGCPEPTSAMACLSGMRSTRSRGAVEAHLRSRFPTAHLTLEPDVTAALACFATPVTVCVVAGTGSIVASHDHAGGLVTTGGTGYPRDPGSGYRLGTCVLRRAGRVDDRDTPGAVAAHAPELTAAADAGERWALDALDAEMDALATQTAAHLTSHHAEIPAPVVGLVGGVWSGATAVRAFTRQLHARSPRAEVVPAVRSTVDAAVLLATGSRR